MGFRITDRDDKRRVEETRKIVTSHIDRRRKHIGGFVDYDEVNLQKELIHKVNAIRQLYRQGHSKDDTMARLRQAIAEVPIDADSLFRDLEPDIILELI